MRSLKKKIINITLTSWKFYVNQHILVQAVHKGLVRPSSTIPDRTMILGVIRPFFLTQHFLSWMTVFLFFFPSFPSEFNYWSCVLRNVVSFEITTWIFFSDSSIAWIRRCMCKIKKGKWDFTIRNAWIFVRNLQSL